MEKTCSVLLLFNFLCFVYNLYIIFRSCDVLTSMNRRDILSRHFYSKRVINIEDFPFSRSYKIQQCITKNTNVWIKFIPSIMTCGKKSFWGIQFYKEIQKSFWGIQFYKEIQKSFWGIQFYKEIQKSFWSIQFYKEIQKSFWGIQFYKEIQGKRWVSLKTSYVQK